MTRFDTLADFISTRMRMQHIYQPAMVATMLRAGGTASISEIAREFVALDRSQLDYYRRIVTTMPGRVLSRHGIVTRHGQHYTLVGYEQLSRAQVDALTKLAERKLQDYIDERGASIWEHRSPASGHVSGPVRYEVLKAARGRCELCGVPAEERFLEVDHIVPRSKGGADDLSNLQALCWWCNGSKHTRDDTDLRRSTAIYSERDPGCPFSVDVHDRAVEANRLALTIRDAHPVTEGHSLVIPRRHVASWADLTRPETLAVDQLVQRTRQTLQVQDGSITGFNLGVNDGYDAGQTVDHAHLHVIPRRSGDTAHPAGGVRGVIPSRQSYPSAARP